MGSQEQQGTVVYYATFACVYVTSRFNQKGLNQSEVLAISLSGMQQPWLFVAFQVEAILRVNYVHIICPNSQHLQQLCMYL